MFRNSIKKSSSNSVGSFEEKKNITLSLAKKEKEKEKEKIKDKEKDKEKDKDKDKEKENSLKIKFRAVSPLQRREKKSLTNTNKSTYISYNKNYNLDTLPCIYNNINNPYNSNSNIKLNSGEITSTIRRKKSINIFKENFKSCNRNLPVVKTRIDSFGIMILKGSKNHSIIFKDKLNEEFDLVEIIDVESYKEDNIQNEYEYKEDGEEDYSELLNLG
jgi:hypothetical protein